MRLYIEMDVSDEAFVGLDPRYIREKVATRIAREWKPQSVSVQTEDDKAFEGAFAPEDAE